MKTEAGSGQAFMHLKDVTTLYASIADGIHQRSYQKKTPAPFRKIVQIRLGNKIDVKPLPMVIDSDAKVIFFNEDAHPDRLVGIGRRTVIDGISHGLG